MTEGMARGCGGGDDSLIVVCDRGRLCNIGNSLEQIEDTYCWFDLFVICLLAIFYVIKSLVYVPVNPLSNKVTNVNLNIFFFLKVLHFLFSLFFEKGDEKMS